MTIELGKRYIRTAPDGEESIIVIKTEREVDYYQSLTEQGFKYKEVIPTVHHGGTCVSCEG